MKAFLSHSSRDKEFVRAVAKELGRQFATFDEQAFASGEEFKRSIESHLGAASVFVLFASAHSMSSLWVEFEIEEAWYQRLQKTLSKSLVYVIDGSINFDSLPEWLRRAKVMSGIVAPKVVARDIRNHLDDLLRERQHSYMVGRSHDLEALDQALTPVDGSVPPHAIFVTGLPGIGRRSLIRRAVPDLLNLSKCVELRINEGDSINDLCITIADHVEPYSTQAGFERIVQKIRDLSDSQALSRILTNLRSMVRANELPLIFDEGGLLDSEGHVQQPVQALLRELRPNDEAYVFFVSSRRPQSALETSVPIVQVRELREADTKRLLTRLSAQYDLELLPAQISELAERVAGYPPAAYFAIEQARDYGIDLMLSDARRLVNFRRSRFLQHLSTLHLADEEQYILRLLAIYSPLPLSVIVNVLDKNAEATQEKLIRLIDLALVSTTQDGHYRIAEPVADAVMSAFGFPSTAENRTLARTVNDLLQESDIRGPRLGLSRILFRAARSANDEAMTKNAVYLASDLIRLTATLYHQRRYQEAIDNGRLAIEERPNNEVARSYLIRALIQEEEWQEAESQIDELQKHAPVRNVHFLEGFLERKRNNIPAAIEAYERSRQAGRRDAAVNRELAQCYLRTENLERASVFIKKALERDHENPYAIDVWAQIATRSRDFKAAREALSRLEVVDKPMRYYHRLSTVELASDHYMEALEAAQKAAESEHFPPFEVLMQLAICQIATNNLSEAEGLLSSLTQRFGSTRRDAQVGLACQLEIARGRYKEALLQMNRIDNKNGFFYKKIRRDALQGQIQTSALDDNVRVAYEDEAAKLSEDLIGVTFERFLPMENS